MHQLSPNEAFFLGLLYSQEYDDKCYFAEFFFFRNEMYDLLISILADLKIPFKEEIQGFRHLFRINYSDLEDFLFTLEITQEQIKYHEIPAIILFAEENIIREFLFGLTECLSITTSNHKILICFDDDYLANFFAQKIFYNPEQFELEIMQTNLEPVKQLEVLDKKVFLNFLKQSEFFSCSKFSEPELLERLIDE